MSNSEETNNNGRSDDKLYRRIEAFLYLEARFMDENQYAEWFDLFDTESIYWIPSNIEDMDPSQHVSILYLDHRGLKNYTQRLMGGNAFAQSPRSRLRRIVSNIEIFEADEPVSAAANFLVTEVRNRTQRLHAGRSEYQLIESETGLKIRSKKVVLVGIDEPQENVTFLL